LFLILRISTEVKITVILLPEYISDFFVSVSAHLPKVDPAILTTLTDDYCADYVVDPDDVEYRLANKNIFKALWTRRHT